MECPSCNGKGYSAAFVDTAMRGWLEPKLKCSLCNGVGQINEQTARWLEIGRIHRERRVKMRETIGECARRLGITPAQLSSMEHGRADPARLAADMLKERA